MPIVVIESAWRETKNICPLCKWPMYSNGKLLICATVDCTQPAIRLTHAQPDRAGSVDGDDRAVDARQVSSDC